MEEYWVRSERSDRHAAGYGGVRAQADRITARGSIVAAVVQEDDVGPPLDAHDLALHAVHGADVLGRQHVLGPPDREDPPAAHQDDVVRVAGGDVQVVADHHHEEAVLVRDPPEHAGDAELMPDVQVGRGLVEEQHVRLLHQAPGQHDLLVLTRRELVEVPHGEVLDAELLQGLVHDLQVVLGGPPSSMRVPPEEHGVDHGQGEGVGGGAWDVAHVLGHVLQRVLRHIPPVVADGAHRWAEDLVDAVHQGGLPDPVRAQYRDDLRSPDVDGDAVQDGAGPLVAESDVVDRDVHPITWISHPMCCPLISVVTRSHRIIGTFCGRIRGRSRPPRTWIRRTGISRGISPSRARRSSLRGRRPRRRSEGRA